MQILVTGGSGSLGLPLVRALIAGTEHRIRLFGRRELPLSANERVSWKAGDLRRKADLQDAVAGADEILHLAGLTHSNRPAEYDAVNAAGTRNLIEAAEAAGVRRLIQFSSWVASEKGGAYARSKLRAEEAVKRSGTGWIILRPANVYGPEQAGALSSFLERVRTSRVVPVPGHGRYVVSPLYVDDLATAVLELLARPALTKRVYTLAGPETLTLNDLVDRVARFHRVRPLRVRVPLFLIALAALAARAAGRDRPARDQLARLRVEREADTTGARRDLGFRPRPLEEGLAAMSGP